MPMPGPSVARAPGAVQANSWGLPGRIHEHENEKIARTQTCIIDTHTFVYIYIYIHDDCMILCIYMWHIYIYMHDINT